MSGAGIVEIDEMSLRFGATQALDGVTLSFRGGEVHGLLGHNGSGKSTLIKCLAGVYTPDSGTLRVNGADLSLPVTPAQARGAGLAFVHQGLGLAGDLSVLENVAVGRFHTGRGGQIRWKQHAELARLELERFGVHVPLGRPVGELPPVEQAIVAIVRALASVEGEPGTRLLVLDEPTVYLPREQVDVLFAAVRAFVAGGDAAVFVSHRIEEVMSLTDQISVLRAGRLVASMRTAEVTEADVVREIVGRDFVDEHVASGEVPEAAEPTVSVRGLAGGHLRHLDLDVAPGEILGVTGLSGSGFDDVPYLLAGARQGSGTVELRSEGTTLDVARLSPRTAIRAGVALIPADRLRYGVVADVSIRENLSLPVLRSFMSGGLLRERRERAQITRVVDDFGVRYGRVDDPMSTLSGGNQQKTVLAKWLAQSPRLVVLHEPTQGVDIGGRFDIYHQLRAAADAGAAVIAAGESPEELAELCDRVVVIRDGVLQAELRGSDVEKHTIVEATVSQSSSQSTSQSASQSASTMQGVQ